MLNKLCVFLLIQIFAFCKGNVDPECLNCICQAETGCTNPGCILLPDGKTVACGYYLIEESYYINCGQPGKHPGDSTETAWKRCSQDYGCSSTCVQAYVNRYGPYCSGQPNPSCEVYARVHDGGPSGCLAASTLSFWNIVSGCLSQEGTTQGWRYPTSESWQTTGGWWWPTSSERWWPTSESWQTTGGWWWPTSSERWWPTSESWQTTGGWWWPTSESWQTTGGWWWPTSSERWWPTSEGWGTTGGWWWPSSESWQTTGGWWWPSTEGWGTTGGWWWPTSDSWWQTTGWWQGTTFRPERADEVEQREIKPESQNQPIQGGADKWKNSDKEYGQIFPLPSVKRFLNHMKARNPKFYEFRRKD